MKFQHTVRLAVKIAGQVDSDRGRPLIGLAYEAAAAFTLDPREIAASAAGLAARTAAALAGAVRSEARAWRHTFHLIGLALTPAPEVICYG